MAKQKQQIDIYMYTVTVKQGVSGTITREVVEGTTVGQLIADSYIKAHLGYGENVSIVCNGETLEDSDTINDGDVLLIEKQAAAKA